MCVCVVYRCDTSVRASRDVGLGKKEVDGFDCAGSRGVMVHYYLCSAMKRRCCCCVVVVPTRVVLVLAERRRRKDDDC